MMVIMMTMKMIHIVISAYFLQDERDLLVNDSTIADNSCKCNEESHLLTSIANTGVLSLVADTPGLFTYRVKELGDWKLDDNSLCQIIVQNIPKV